MRAIKKAKLVHAVDVDRDLKEVMLESEFDLKVDADFVIAVSKSTKTTVAIPMANVVYVIPADAKN